MLCFENISVMKTVITSWYYGEKIHPLPCLLLRNSIAIGKTEKSVVVSRTNQRVISIPPQENSDLQNLSTSHRLVWWYRGRLPEVMYQYFESLGPQGE